MEKIVLTGANRGIGLGLVNKLVDKGHILVVGVRNPEVSEELIKIKEKKPDNLNILKLDLLDDKSIVSFCESINFTNIDILINNAGILEDESLEKLQAKSIARTFEINTLGPIKITQLLINKLLKAKNPKSFYISSQMGSISDNLSGGYYGYRISKCALNMFCKSLSNDYPELICISLHPGWVRTKMGGPNAKTNVEDSTSGLVRFMENCDKTLTGKFFNYKGQEIPW
tara:strand:+ start:240 stop:923 length:684 start_codon:yes stop_codon:yes gene_type:complete